MGDPSISSSVVTGGGRGSSSALNRPLSRRRVCRSCRARDLVLLKLFAGGAQDGWDIAQLLAGPDRASIAAGVGAELDDLPVRCRRLWNRIVDTALDDDDDDPIRSADRQN